MFKLKILNYTILLLLMVSSISCGQDGGVAPGEVNDSSACNIDSSWTPKYEDIKFYFNFDGTVGSVISNGTTIEPTIGTTLSSIDGGDNSMTYSTGVINQSISVDGLSDYLKQTSNDSSLDITGDLTISYWVNGEVNKAGATTVAKTDITGSIPFILLFNNDLSSPGQFSFLDRNSGSGQQTEIRTDTIMSENSWYHMTVVRDVSADTISVYINGVKDGATSPSLKTPDGSNQELSIFARSDGNFPIKGKMDELAIWNSALSSQEVSLIYQTQNGCR